METPNVIESAKRHPIVKNYISGNQLILENKPSPKTAEDLNLAGKHGNANLWMQIATKSYVETLLTKRECEAVLNWMCNEEMEKIDFENSSNIEKLEYYKILKDSGKISEEEFIEMRKILIEQ